MQIFSNFDTKLADKMYQKYSESYWSENVLIVFKNNVFLAIYVIIPLILYLLFISGVAWLFFIVDFWAPQLNYYKWVVFTIGVIIVTLIVGWKLLKRFIDYEMDFAIITPEEVVFYEQDGILSREGITLNSSKLRSITVEKDWLLRSIFNFGNLLFLAEGYHEDGWDIRFVYLDDPDNKKYKAREILRKWSNPDIDVE